MWQQIVLVIVQILYTYGIRLGTFVSEDLKLRFWQSDVILVQNMSLVKLIIITFLLLFCRFLARMTSLVSEPSSVTGCESLVPGTSTEEVGDDPQSKVCKRDGAESVRPCKTLTDSQIPDYPLLPLSKGCLLTLQKLAVKFKDTLRDRGVLMT